MSGRAAELQERFEGAVFLHRTGRLDEAAACYRALLAEVPHVPLVHYNYGLVQRARGDRAAAAASFREALRLQPDLAEAHINLANALYPHGDLAEAERHCREALRLAPHLAQAYSNLGNILRDQSRLGESADAFREALQRWPGDSQLRNNLGNTLKALGDLPAAAAAYRTALRQQPDNAEILYNLGTLDLLAGRFAEGWRGYEHRWQPGLQGARPIGAPLWTGQPAPEDTVLIHAEQGLGDTIQFCRYVPLAAGRAQVAFLVPPELKRLTASLHPGLTVVTGGDRVPAHAFQCPVASLPLVFGTTLETIPDATPYVHAEPGAVARWRSRLARLGGARVGLVWAGNLDNPADRRRSLALRDLTGLLALPGVSFVSLQKGPAASQAPAFRIADWTGELKDLADTAALIEALDLVIGVDTAVVHLAGALGKPVWLLNRFDTDWRWLLGRDDSPWYPTLRQFRQQRPGDWHDVVAAVTAALTR